MFLSHQQTFGTTPTACIRFAELSRIEILHILLEHSYDSQRNRERGPSSPTSSAGAKARVSELVGSGAGIRIIVGRGRRAGDRSSALTVAAAVGADVQLLDDIEHALAGEPGIEPAPVAKRQSPPSGSAST